MIALNKEELRQYFRELRKRSGNTIDLSVQAWKNLSSLQVWKQAHYPMVYISSGSELSTYPILNHYFVHQQTILVPYCLPNHEMCALAVSSFDDLAPGSYGILEPKNPQVSMSVTPDVILIPGLAFDTAGTRLGQGGGYFDRYLQLLPKSVVKIGYCSTLQLYDQLLPQESHDVAMDFIVTDAEVVTCVSHRS